MNVKDSTAGKTKRVRHCVIIDVPFALEEDISPVIFGYNNDSDKQSENGHNLSVLEVELTAKENPEASLMKKVKQNDKSGRNMHIPHFDGGNDSGNECHL